MNEKNIFILLGSPRKQGNSELLARSFERGAIESGFTVDTLHLSGLKLNGCLDCRQCWKRQTPCIQKDDMEKVYSGLEKAAVLVFVSPLYYFSWSSQIKPVWDRLLPYNSAVTPVSMAGKKSLLLAAAGGDAACYEGLRASFRLACSYMQWGIAGELCATDVYTKGEIEKKGDWLEQAELLGKSITL